jgi:hypothetical protein
VVLTIAMLTLGLGMEERTSRALPLPSILNRLYCLPRFRVSSYVVSVAVGNIHSFPTSPLSSTGTCPMKDRRFLALDVTCLKKKLIVSIMLGVVLPIAGDMGWRVGMG